MFIMLGVGHNVYYVRRWFHAGITVSYSSHHRHTRNSVTELPEVGVQLPEWRVTLHVYAWQ